LKVGSSRFKVEGQKSKVGAGGNKTVGGDGKFVRKYGTGNATHDPS
jgi:hypothetical protein